MVKLAKRQPALKSCHESMYRAQTPWQGQYALPRFTGNIVNCKCDLALKSCHDGCMLPTALYELHNVMTTCQAVYTSQLSLARRHWTDLLAFPIVSKALPVWWAYTICCNGTPWPSIFTVIFVGTHSWWWSKQYSFSFRSIPTCYITSGRLLLIKLSQHCFHCVRSAHALQPVAPSGV